MQISHTEEVSTFVFSNYILSTALFIESFENVVGKTVVESTRDFLNIEIFLYSSLSVRDQVSHS
jgi:hypothetical protein